MDIREVVSKRKHGPDVPYVQLCESEWERSGARSPTPRPCGKSSTSPIMESSECWTRPVPDWSIALDHLAIVSP